MIENDRNGLEIAIIGLTGRFPGAKNVAEYWQNLRAGLKQSHHSQMRSCSLLG